VIEWGRHVQTLDAAMPPHQTYREKKMKSLISKKSAIAVVVAMVFSGIFVRSGYAYNADEGTGSGPYSSAQANMTADAPDAGIPGFVGLDGDGVTPDGGDGNNYVNPVFIGWATDVIDYSPSDTVGTYGTGGIGSQFGDPTKALGAVTGDNFDIVSLGDMGATEIAAGNASGSITLGFEYSIINGSGADFAVFENGFISAGGAGVSGQIFAELGYVEVSTDGETFVRFPSVSLTDGQVGAYGTVDPTEVYNLVGKHVNAYGSSWGTPFDLDDLLNTEEVLLGLVDLDEINYVRIVDIPGDGSFVDSQGNPIYDAWLTWGSGGLDLEAVGVIHQIPEPLITVTLAYSLLLLVRHRNS